RSRRCCGATSTRAGRDSIQAPYLGGDVHAGLHPPHVAVIEVAGLVTETLEALMAFGGMLIGVPLFQVSPGGTVKAPRIGGSQGGEHVGGVPQVIGHRPHADVPQFGAEASVRRVGVALKERADPPSARLSLNQDDRALERPAESKRLVVGAKEGLGS